ncbi:MAG: Flp family type IVb pilin [Robiginitomaculum sp.]|nr:MAG: Flp family type IVb pilin [Robiginitomaculum sp.]
MQNFVTRFVKDESGATAIEYGLIAALISVGIIAAASALGANVSNKFNDISNAVNAA